MKEKTKWSKSCPLCNTIQYYNSGLTLSRAIKNNTKCSSCRATQTPCGENHPLYGTSLSEEHKRKIKETRKLQIFTTETRKKMSISKTGEANPFYNKKHTDDAKRKISIANTNPLGDVRKKMSDAHKNRIITSETRKKMSKNRMGDKNPMYGKSNKHSEQTKLKIRKTLLKNIENRYGMVFPNYNPSSIPIIEAKARELGIIDLQHAENGGEFHIKELGYWVDGYSKEKNIVIEYDEPHHKRQVEKDQIRQKEITEYLGCKFIRISEK